MKKFFILFLFVGAMLLTTQAQTVLFSDDFESYSAGDFVAQVGDQDWWTTWSNEPGSSEDAVVSDAQNHTSGGSLSAHTQGNTTDLVLKLGNKTSGVYQVEFYYYIPSGKGGYFNFQHTENMGEEWAFDVYFGNNGQGYLYAEGSNHNFTHPNDQWIYIKFIADLYQDSAYLWIDNNKILQWVFSHESNGTEGTKQLGAIDFYAGAPSGQTPEWYLDDVVYTEIQAGLEPPEVTLNATEIQTTGDPFVLTLTNDGEENLIYDAYIRYPEPETKIISTSNSTWGIVNQKIVHLGPSSLTTDIQKLDNPIHVELPKDITLTHLQGDIESNLGFSSQVDVLEAALFKSNVIKDYIGMNLSSLIIYVGDLPVSGSTYAKVWKGRIYSTPGPVTEVASQAFTPAEANSQNPITLDNPVFINGDDLWFGWAFTDPGANTYCMPMDGGPIVDDGNWFKYGPSWSELTNPDYGNWGLVGTLTGDTIHTWVNMNYSYAGQVEPGQTVSIPIGFDKENIEPGVEYHATLVIRTNDPDDDEELIEIPITYQLSTKVDVTENNIDVYPNPVSDFLSINSQNSISKIEIYSLLGQLIKSSQINDTNAKVDVSNLDEGVYILKVYSGEKVYTQRFVVE